MAAAAALAKITRNIILHELNIALEGRCAVQMRVYDTPARFDRCMVAQIVCGFEHNPGRIVRPTGRCTQTFPFGGMQLTDFHFRHRARPDY